MPSPTELRAIADAKFKKKELQRLDGCAAMAEYQAAGRATMEKTARLKALRLSRTARHPSLAAPKRSRRATSSRPNKIATGA